MHNIESHNIHSTNISLTLQTRLQQSHTTKEATRGDIALLLASWLRPMSKRAKGLYLVLRSTVSIEKDLLRILLVSKQVVILLVTLVTHVHPIAI